MVDYRNLFSILIKITAWFMKFGLTILGLALLITPGYAPYLRVLGFITALIGILTFNTVQARLMSERGIRIPNAVVAVLLIGGIIAVVGLTPGAGDLQLNNEQVENNGDQLSFEVDATNTGDGPTLGDVYISFELVVDGETISQTEEEPHSFQRGETKSLTANFEISEEVQTQIENGGYEIIVHLGDSEDSESPRTVRYTSSELN